jgi:hypothetical protein
MRAVKKVFSYLNYFAARRTYSSPSEFAAYIADGPGGNPPTDADFQTARRAIKVLADAGLLEVQEEDDMYTGEKKPAKPAKYRLNRAAVNQLLANPPHPIDRAKKGCGAGVMLRRALGYIAWFTARPGGMRAREFGLLLAHEANVVPAQVESFLDRKGLQKANRVIKTLREMNLLKPGGSRCRTCTRACSWAARFMKADGTECVDRKIDNVWMADPNAVMMLIRETRTPANSNGFPARRAA